MDGHQIKKTKNITPTKLAEQKVATEKVLLLMIITPMHTQLIKYLGRKKKEKGNFQLAILLSTNPKCITTGLWLNENIYNSKY